MEGQAMCSKHCSEFSCETAGVPGHTRSGMIHLKLEFQCTVMLQVWSAKLIGLAVLTKVFHILKGRGHPPLSGLLRHLLC